MRVLFCNLHFVIFNTKSVDHEVEVFLEQNTVRREKKFAKRFAPDFRSDDMFGDLVDKKTTFERMSHVT